MKEKVAKQKNFSENQNKIVDSRYLNQLFHFKEIMEFSLIQTEYGEIKNFKGQNSRRV